MRLRSCVVCKALLHKLQTRISLRCRVVWIRRAIGIREMKDVIMAKVIEFYIPIGFRKPLKSAARVKSGKLVEFGLPTKKSA
jgi:hypothetical protein